MSAPRRPPRRRINGVLLLDKPAGITSNAALGRAKRLYDAEKADTRARWIPWRRGCSRCASARRPNSPNCCSMPEALRRDPPARGHDDDAGCGRRGRLDPARGIRCGGARRGAGALHRPPETGSPAHSALKFRGRPVRVRARRDRRPARAARDRHPFPRADRVAPARRHRRCPVQQGHLRAQPRGRPRRSPRLWRAPGGAATDGEQQVNLRDAHTIDALEAMELRQRDACCWRPRRSPRSCRACRSTGRSQGASCRASPSAPGRSPTGSWPFTRTRRCLESPTLSGNRRGRDGCSPQCRGRTSGRRASFLKTKRFPSYNRPLAEGATRRTGESTWPSRLPTRRRSSPKTSARKATPDPQRSRSRAADRPDQRADRPFQG